MQLSTTVPILKLRVLPQREAAQLVHEHMVPKQRQEASHPLPMALDTWSLPLLSEDGGDALSLSEASMLS